MQFETVVYLLLAREGKLSAYKGQGIAEPPG